MFNLSYLNLDSKLNSLDENTFVIDSALALRDGLDNVVKSLRTNYPKAKIIYDHGCAGTDIPEMGKNFAVVCKKAGVDGIIISPTAGPETERAWIYHARNNDLKVIIGLNAVLKEEGGFITNVDELYRIAARAGVTNYIVPEGLKNKINEIITSEGVNDFKFYNQAMPRINNSVNKIKPSVKLFSELKGVIPACDVPTLEGLEKLVNETTDVPGIAAYKIGFELCLTYGIKTVTDIIRKHTNKPIVYDHQKAGTNSFSDGSDLAKVCASAGVNDIIFFPQAGPKAEEAYIHSALNAGLQVIVGGRMTHPAYAVSEGGFIDDAGALNIYRIAAKNGITHFVVPGNKPEVIKEVNNTVIAEGVTPVFCSPGFIAQGGNLEDAAKMLDKLFAIVGRKIYQADDMRKAALDCTKALGY